MKTRVTAIAGFLLLMLGAAVALAQSGDWQRVPSALPSMSGALGGMLGKFGGKSNIECTLVARLAEDAAKARDKGVSEQTQLKTVDDPHSTFQTIAAASHLPAGTTQALSAMIHGEIAYVYAHREMTPGQLESHFRDTCEHQQAAQ